MSCEIKLYVLLIMLLSVQSLDCKDGEFKLGVELISKEFIQSIFGETPLKVGLITNQTGKDQKGNRTIDILLQKGIVIERIFAPEHGIQGTVLASGDVPHEYDEKTGIAISSLYSLGSGKNIDNELLEYLDALIFDIQDSGMRHYTYISTLFNAMQTAAKAGKTMIVLDRPNPLGRVIEGPLVDPSLKSFISIASIPLRHGMTVGELARYFNRYALEIPCKLLVIPMAHYNPTSQGNFSFWTSLSPNIACVASCYGYSLGGLLGEVAPFEIGIGTAKAFTQVMLPEKYPIAKKQWDQLIEELKKYGIQARFDRILVARKKQWHHGIFLTFDDIHRVRAFDAFLCIVSFARNNEVPIAFSKIFDKAAGSALVRHFLSGTIPRTALDTAIYNQMKPFIQQLKKIVYYTPAPFF